ncbi:MAG: hypothetical protein WC792_02780 [Candidatus Micrarchaeia archaeon]|jgi:hypothetical protein
MANQPPRAVREQKPQGLYSGVGPAARRPQKAVSTVPFFVAATRALYKYGRKMGFGKNAKFTPDQQENMEFLNYEVSAEEFYCGYMSVAFFGMFAGIIAAGLIMLGLGGIDQNVRIVFAGLSVLAPLAISYMYLTFPASEVEREKRISLAYIPEIVNYLVMSMRLSPNLEKAVEFAATHGRGKIADDLKRIVWEVQLGNYASVEEGLDDLAYRWGDKSDDFKHALMLIRTSLIETDANKRSDLLEKASLDVLEGSKEKMDLYARQLHQPTVYLYYFGILLPLMLAIILPIGSSFTGQNIAKPEYLVLLYNIFIPIGIYLFGGSILGNRPPTYVPPDIPDDFPNLPPKGKMRFLGALMPYATIAASAFVLIAGIGYFLDQATISAIPSYALKDALPNLPHIEWLYEGEYKLFVSYLTLFGVLIAASVSASIYLVGKYGARKAVQDEVRSMETEFKDALYVLASRLGENRPMEDALRHATDFLPKSKIANQIFKRILDNISSLGMTLEAAIFDPAFGAVKNYPSQVIRGGMRIMVDAVDLGVNVAAKSLISLSMQIRNSQKIDEMLRKLLEDVTMMLGTMATFIAPVVLAVVASLQRMIVNSLANSCAQQTEVPSQAMQGTQMGGMGNILCKGGSDAAGANADPLTFTLIMGVYVLEVVVLLTYFNSQIEDTNNDLHTKMSIAGALPIAAILFAATAYAVSFVIGGASSAA